MVAERKEGHMAKPPLLNQLCGVGKRLCSPPPTFTTHPLKREKFFGEKIRTFMGGLLSLFIIISSSLVIFAKIKWLNYY